VTPAGAPAIAARDTLAPPGGRDPDTAERPATRRESPLHPSSLAVLVVGLTISLLLAIGAAFSINESDGRLLRMQLHQDAAALAASLPPLQDPLIAANGIAASVGPKTFRAYIAALVGHQSPFDSVSLWHVHGHDADLLAVDGARPTLPGHWRSFAQFLGTVHPSPQLAIAGLLREPDRSLAFAERPPQSTSGLVVYAQEDLAYAPAHGSPFAGLNYAVYLGATPTRSNLLAASAHLPFVGRTASKVVRFGDGEATIVTELVGTPSGVLPSQVPWVIGLGGTLLAVLAALTTERLLRRRESAELVARTRERQYTEQRGIAQTLQHSLLPSDQPSFPGVSMAGRYVAGAAELDIGGDWYDAIPLDDHRLFVAIGDVAGRGLAAARLMASLRHAIRAYAVQGDDPATVLHKLDELVDVERIGCFATVLCAVVDVPSRTVALASAGHPTPLLLADGAWFLTCPVRPPVGVPPRERTHAASHQIERGATLLFYTDGLVERRDRSIDDGLASLRAAATRAAGPIDAVVDDVLNTLVGDGPHDDLAVLGVRLAGARRGEGEPADDADRARTVVTRRFPCGAAAVSDVRTFVSDALRTLDTDLREDAVLLTSELAANAVQHARTPFEVTVETDGTARVRIGVSDAGDGVPARQDVRQLDPRGRGLHLVERLAARWGVDWPEGGSSKTVWFELRRESVAAALPTVG
jgi:serine phosphatase RsbU (regulator of sigma subunit)/anti-sigma regulatory factor (Ser/Thr protein kinase)